MAPIRFLLVMLILTALWLWELARAAVGYLRHGRHWEPGAGLALTEDCEP